MIPSIDRAQPVDSSSRFTPGRPGAGLLDSLFDAASPSGAPTRYDADLDPEDMLRRAQEAHSQASTYVQQTVRAQWARAYKAYRNEHFDGSKYHSAHYAGRSKYFRPKTRTAINKKMAMAAAALYSTNDVVAITAQNESDEYQVASAALKQHLMNYRLSRVSRRNGIRWFLTSMGGVQTALLTGLVISKQTWVYREEDPRALTMEQRLSGKPVKVEDRPDIALLPPENVLFDPNCDWTNPAQTSQYLIIRYPMSVDEAYQMIEDGRSAGDQQFKAVSRDQIAARQQTIGPMDTAGPRQAREGGRDPKQQASGHYGRVWLYECFMRVGGLDVVFWTLDNQMVISEITPVRLAYPAMCGERPVVIGYGSFEAFRCTPMALAESLAQMQMETNDQVNLRLDHMKNVVTPAAKVVRGRQIDLQQVQSRGPNRIVMVQEPGDVDFWQPPDLPQSAYVENNLLSADMDSLAGVFDASSVNTNRQLNETVGGMRLLANSVNPVNDFDLSVLVETWLEPALWQVMKLEEKYESDPVILAICGQKAKLIETFGLDTITDELLAMESSCVIKIGVGSSNLPQEKIQRLAMAWQTATGILGPFVQAGVIKPPVPKAKAIIEEVFGNAGMQDGGERFFEDLDGGPPQPQPPNPAMMAQAQNEKDRNLIAREKNQMDFAHKMATIKQKRAENLERIDVEHMRSLAEIGRAMLDHRHDANHQFRDHSYDHFRSGVEHERGMLRADLDASRDAALAHQAGAEAAAGAPGA